MLAGTTVTWRGLVLGGESSPYRLDVLRGWLGLPGTRSDDRPRPGGHGSNPARVLSESRVVTVEGWYPVSEDRDAALLALEAAFSLDEESLTETLTVGMAGRVLVAQAQLLQFGVTPVRSQWGVGRFEWAAQWRTPDPRRYATTPVILSTPLQQPGGGIAPPWTPPLVLPTRAAGGYLTPTNTGTASTPILATLTGPQNQPGVLNASTNQVLRYGIDLDADDVLTIDTARGVAVLNGTAYRAPLPGSTVTRNFQLPTGTSDLQALGSGTGTGAPMFGVEFRPASW